MVQEAVPVIAARTVQEYVRRGFEGIQRVSEGISRGLSENATDERSEGGK